MEAVRRAFEREHARRTRAVYVEKFTCQQCGHEEAVVALAKRQAAWHTQNLGPDRYKQAFPRMLWARKQEFDEAPHTLRCGTCQGYPPLATFEADQEVSFCPEWHAFLRRALGADAVVVVDEAWVNSV